MNELPMIEVEDLSEYLEAIVLESIATDVTEELNLED